MKKLKVSLWVFFSLSSALSSVSFAASVDLKLDIKFSTNKAEIDESGQKSLEHLFEVLKSFPAARVLISGHTDSLGSDTYNEGLSVRRAKIVEQTLISKGVDKDLINSKGFGESAPIDSNQTPSGRANNRRVVASLLGLSDEEVEKISATLNGTSGENQDNSIKILENESEAVVSYKENLETQGKEIVSELSLEGNGSGGETALANVVEKDVSESVEVGTFSEESSHKENKKEKRKLRYYATGYLGPHWSSQYSDGDINFEHGKFTPLSFGLDVGMKISRRWFADAYFYYLPTEVKEGSSGIDFSKGDSIKYQNNVYGVRAGYIWKGSRTYRLSLITGLVSHTFGGLERTGVNTYNFNKYEHTGLTLGFRVEKKITKTWVFDSDLAYLLPLSISDIEDGKGKFWYRGILGVKKRLSNRMRLSVEYQAVYHESDFTFASGYKSRPEFFIQTLMLGLKYRF